MRKTRLLFVGIIILAAFLRFFLLHSIPPGLYPDEAANGVDALHALDRADFRVFYPTNNGREGLFIDLQALSLQMFGVSAWSLRAVSAAAGTLTVLFFYLLAKELGLRLFSARGTTRNNTRNDAENERHRKGLVGEISKTEPSASRDPEGGGEPRPQAGMRREKREGEVMQTATIFALLAAFLLAVSFWHINFSRIGFRAILLPLFSSALFYFLLRAHRAHRAPDFILSGFFLGLSLYTYIASRILPVVTSGFFLFDLFRGLRNRAFILRWGTFLLAFAFTVLPLAGYFITHPSDFTGRAADVSVFATQHPVHELAKSALKTLGMFNVAGDTNWRHNIAAAPQLDAVTGIFFLVGFLFLLFSLSAGNRRSAAALFLFIWWGAMLLPAIATAEGLPHALRSLGAIPPVFLIAAYGGMVLYERLTKRLNHSLRSGLIPLVLSAILLTNFSAYFHVWAGSPNVQGAFRSDLANIAAYTNAHNDVRRYVIVNENGVPLDGIPMSVATIRFLTSDDPTITYLTPQRLSEITPDFDKTLIMTTQPPSDELDAGLRALFPTVQRADEQGITLYKL